MSDKNQDVERLERENAALRAEIDSLRADPGDCPVAGCGDITCPVEMSRGMATKGGCRCTETTLRIALRWHKRLAAFHRETIKEQRARPVDGGAEEERAAIVAWLRQDATIYDDGTLVRGKLLSTADIFEQGAHRLSVDRGEDKDR